MNVRQRPGRDRWRTAYSPGGPCSCRCAHCRGLAYPIVSLALAGSLRHSGWPLEQTEIFVKAVVEAAGDEEATDRIRAARDTVLELGGHASSLLLLWVVAAELAYQQTSDVFGTVEDLAAHKARSAELEAKRKELYARSPSSWVHGDATYNLHIGRITGDGAALITFAKAPGEVPAHPPETAGQRLVEYLLRKEAGAKAA